MSALALSKLESYLWGAAVLLRGTIDAGDYKQFIFPLLFSERLCDVFDEEAVTRERAQSFLTDEHLQRVVRAYQDFKGEPGFTRVVPIEEIRAKEGNLSIPRYVGGNTQAQTDEATGTATTALPVAIAAWMESSYCVRTALDSLIAPTVKKK